MCSLTLYWSAAVKKGAIKTEVNGVAKGKFYSDKHIKATVKVQQNL